MKIINLISTYNHSYKKKYEEVLYEWLENKKNNIKESTYIKYLYEIENNIIPYFKNTNFKNLNTNSILNYFNLEDIKKLSNSTKSNLLIIIKSSINFGIERKWIKKFNDIELKFEKKKNEITYLSKIEQNIIENYVRNNMNIRNLMILVALYTGIRIGELCGLKGNDIDFINNTISINKTVQRIKDTSNSNKKTKLVVGIPKTKSSNRIIPVPEFIIELLKRYIINNNYYIFTNSSKPKDPRTVEKYFTNILKKLDINNYNFHSLRHTYATRLRERKVDIKVISELLGHSDWRITQSIYVHASFELKKESIKELCELWS